MSWLWFAIILAAGLAGCLGIYREMLAQDAHKASIKRSRSIVLEVELREAHAAEYIVDTIKRFHLRENRTELKALWNDQYVLLITPMSDLQRERLWRGNRGFWGHVIEAKGRIRPMGKTA